MLYLQNRRCEFTTCTLKFKRLFCKVLVTVFLDFEIYIKIRLKDSELVWKN